MFQCIAWSRIFCNLSFSCSLSRSFLSFLFFLVFFNALYSKPHQFCYFANIFLVSNDIHFFQVFISSWLWQCHFDILKQCFYNLTSWLLTVLSKLCTKDTFSQGIEVKPNFKYWRLDCDFVKWFISSSFCLWLISDVLLSAMYKVRWLFRWICKYHE